MRGGGGTDRGRRSHEYWFKNHASFIREGVEIFREFFARSQFMLKKVTFFKLGSLANADNCRDCSALEFLSAYFHLVVSFFFCSTRPAITENHAN